MGAPLRIWFVACAADAPPGHAFAERVRALANEVDAGRRIADAPEFVAAFALSGVWRGGAELCLDDLPGTDRPAEALWLAAPEHVARRLAAALELPAGAARRLTPRPYTLTALDHAALADARGRPSLAGFELDWRPPPATGGFPGAARGR